MGSSQLYSLSWGELGSSLSTTVQLLRDHNEMVDVTLAAGGRIFPAHKLVLSAASPLLMQLLKSTACQHPVIMLAGITAVDLEALLQFIYVGEVNMESQQLPSFLQAAHCLDIQALSPSTLESEKTSPILSLAPVQSAVLTKPNTTTTITSSLNEALSRDVTNTLSTVRKRKRRQPSINSDTSKWARQETQENMPAGGTDSQEGEHSKDSSTDNNAPNSDDISGKKLVSDLPVECSVCGVTLRQSRNLRRHMELMHLKAEGVERVRKRKLKNKVEGAMLSNLLCSPLPPPLTIQQRMRDSSETAAQLPPPPPTLLRVPGPSQLPPPTLQRGGVGASGALVPLPPPTLQRLAAPLPPPSLQRVPGLSALSLPVLQRVPGPAALVLPAQQRGPGPSLLGQQKLAGPSLPVQQRVTGPSSIPAEQREAGPSLPPVQQRVPGPSPSSLPGMPCPSAPPPLMLQRPPPPTLQRASAPSLPPPPPTLHMLTPSPPTYQPPTTCDSFHSFSQEPNFRGQQTEIISSADLYTVTTTQLS